MNLLLINQYAGSDEMGMEYRPFYLARHWVRMGHKVTVVTASFSHLRLKNPDMLAQTQKRTLDGVEYLFLRTTSYSQNNRKRALSVIQFVQTLHRMAKSIAQQYQPDVVISSSTHPFDFRPAEKIAHLSGAKLVFELHDIWPQSPMELHGYQKNHPLMLLIQKEEDRAFQHADLVVSLLPFAHLYVQERGYQLKRYVHIPNGIECQGEDKAVKPPKKHLDLLRKYRDQGMFLVLYVGGFSTANALEDFVKAAGRCSSDILFVGVGNGPMKVPLKRLARVNGIHNILFLDGVTREQLPGVLELADCLYIGAKNIDLYRYGVSMNKLFDYMLAGKPIIYGVNSTNNPVEEAGCGVSITSEDPMAIVEAVENLRALPESQRKEMGNRGREFVCTNHDYSVLAREFLNVIEGTIGDGDEKTQERE